MLYKVVLASESVDQYIQMKAIEQYFPVVMFFFFLLCKVIATFESVEEIVKFDHSNEHHWAILSCGTDCTV